MENYFLKHINKHQQCNFLSGRNNKEDCNIINIDENFLITKNSIQANPYCLHPLEIIQYHDDETEIILYFKTCGTEKTYSFIREKDENDWKFNNKISTQDDENMIKNNNRKNKLKL